jgi:hypothetical protein
MNKLFIPENDPAPCKVVWTHFHPHFITGENADVMHPHFSGNSSQNFMAVFKLYLEHSITQRLNNRSVLLDKCLFSHSFGERKDRRISFKNSPKMAPIEKKPIFTVQNSEK